MMKQKTVMIFALAAVMLAGVAQANVAPVIVDMQGQEWLLANAQGTWLVSAYDPDAAYLVYSADWGDGTVTPAGSSPQITHAYSAVGNYTAAFTVTDDQGASAVSLRNITVYVITEPDCPGFAKVKNWDTLSADRYDMALSDVDHYNSSEHYAGIRINSSQYESGLHRAYKWAPLRLTAPNGDQLMVEVCEIYHSLMASRSSAWLRFTVNGSASPPPNLPPVITGVSGPASLAQGEAGNWSISAYDPDGTCLSYSVLWGDASSYKSSALASAQIGSVANLQHTYSQEGNHTITFMVADSGGASAQSMLTVNVIPTLPEPVLDYPPAPPGSLCYDGTKEGECSAAKPQMCVNGYLLDNAAKCGCPDGLSAVGKQCTNSIFGSTAGVPVEPNGIAASSASVPMEPVTSFPEQPAQLDRILSLLEEIKQILLQILAKI